jgi:hypothetical protein
MIRNSALLTAHVQRSPFAHNRYQCTYLVAKNIHFVVSSPFAERERERAFLYNYSQVFDTVKVVVAEFTEVGIRRLVNLAAESSTVTHTQNGFQVII